MSIVTDALESSVTRSTAYFNPLLRRFQIRYVTPSGPLNIYPSSLLTVDNIQRLSRCVLHFESLDFSIFTLQDNVHELHRILGADLLRELQRGLNLPLYQLSDGHGRTANPFSTLVIPSALLRGYFPGTLRSIYDEAEKDLATYLAFTSSLYNLAYLNQTIPLIEYNWLFAQLLARIPDQDVDIAGALLGLVPDLYKRCTSYTPGASTERHISYLERPRDPKLLATYNQISYELDTHCSTYNGETSADKLMLLLFLISAPDTVPYADCPASVSTMPVQRLVSYDSNHCQAATKLLPSSCYALCLGTTGFHIPALNAISQYGTNVLLFPATRECYRFLCKLYGLKPCDGITPLPDSYAMLWGSLFSPFTFCQVLRQERIRNANSTPFAQHIFNGEHSLTEYIPGMEYSDAPQYRVNEFEVPK